MIQLLADIGGTNTRCTITDRHGNPGAVHEFVNREHPTLESLLTRFADLLPRDGRPTSGFLAIAAPLDGDHVRMVNNDWQFSIDAIRDVLGLESLRAINDFEALAMALPQLTTSGLIQVGGGRVVNDKPKGLIGPGTGLGVASLLRANDHWIPVGGEGGHVTLPAVDDREAQVIETIRGEFGHCSAERLISGPGLQLLHRALHGGPERSATDIARLADADDASANDTLAIFFRMLGTVAANLALTIGAFGGIYIGGGIVPRHVDRFVASQFRQRFESKGRYDRYLESIPTFVIVAEHATLTGLAALSADRRA